MQSRKRIAIAVASAAFALIALTLCQRHVEISEAPMMMPTATRQTTWTYNLVFVAKAIEPHSAKKGVANTGRCTEAQAVGAAWQYDWSPQPQLCEGLENVAMVWGAGDVEREVVADSDWLLTFNEPDQATQANLTPAQAAELYRRIEELHPDKLLVSPATAAGLGNWQNALDWMRAWRGEYVARYNVEPRVNAIAYHWYGWESDSINVAEKFKALAREWGVLKLWLTEFAFLVGDGQACGGWTFDRSAPYARQFLDYLERDPMIERYAWFATSYDPLAWFAFQPIGCNAPLLNLETGTRTRWGELYRIR